MTATDQMLREIINRESIRDLPVRYCDCLWRKDLDGLVDLFAADARFVIGGSEVDAACRGLDAIRKMHEKALAETTPRLFVHNQIVNLLGDDRATSRCAVEVRNLNVTMEWIGIGYFEDEFVKQGDQWKFLSRYHTFDGIDNKVYLRTFIA